MTPSGVKRSRLIWSRLLIGLIVLISAEVFSGASLKIGLWHPWTLIVTFWLYFAHFFFFTTLAVWTGRTSFWSLYLWGLLFGLYESWITKVIWHGYSGDGKFVLGNLGPYGFSEISMVVIFHPIMSLILPLAVVCIVFPSLRRLFPDLAWFTGSSKWARITRVYLMVNFGAIVAMNSGGPVNLALNVVFALLVLMGLLRLSKPSFSMADARSIVVFGRWAFCALCIYLALLYAVTYVLLRPDGLPSIRVQGLTLVFYALSIAGLWLHRSREPAFVAPLRQIPELAVVLTLVAVVLGLGLLLSAFSGRSVLLFPVIAGFLIWTPLGLLLVFIAIVKGGLERRTATSGQSP